MKDNMIPFRGLSYVEYVRKAEDVEQDAKERKVGHYSTKKSGLKTKPTNSSKPNEKSKDKNPSKAGKSSKKPQLSREEMMKQGICFTCGEKGHISKKCPKKKNDAHLPKSNSIRIRSNP